MRAWLLNVFVMLGWVVGFNLLATFWLALISIKATASVFHYLYTQVDPWIGGVTIVVFVLLASAAKTDLERHRE